MNKIILLVLIFVSTYLLAASTYLNYPIGYHSNSFIYGMTLFYCIFYFWNNCPVIIKNNRELIKNGCLLAGSFGGIMFFVSAGLIIVPILETFDFDDRIVFYDGKYRIVVTADIIRSGGQSYFAVLKRQGWAEHCILRTQGCPLYSNPKIIEKGGQIILVQTEISGEESSQIIPNE